MKYQRMLLLLFLFLTVAQISVFSQQMNYTEDTVYRDDKYPFSIFYPRDWMKVAPSHAQTRLKVVSIDGKGYTDFNINVLYVKNLEKTSSSDHVKLLINSPKLIDAMVKTGNPNARILSSGATYLNNREAFYVKAQGVVRSLDDEVDMIFYQIFSLYEGNVYTLTFRAAKEDFDRDLPTFKAMIASFAVRPIKLAR